MPRVEKVFFHDKNEDVVRRDIEIPPEKLKKKLKQSLDCIKTIDKAKFNAYYFECLKRSGKTQNSLSSLPIPTEFKEIPWSLKVKLGEGLYMIRPLVYCLTKIYFGETSFKPYLVSLMIDVVSCLMQWKMQFVDEMEYNEITTRTRDRFMKYIWRSPVYNLWKMKILIPLLDKLFPKFGFIKKVIIYIIEIRSSLSLLM